MIVLFFEVISMSPDVETIFEPVIVVLPTVPASKSLSLFKRSKPDLITIFPLELMLDATAVDDVMLLLVLDPAIVN